MNEMIKKAIVKKVGKGIEIVRLEERPGTNQDIWGYEVNIQYRGVIFYNDYASKEIHRSDRIEYIIKKLKEFTQRYDDLSQEKNKNNIKRFVKYGLDIRML